MTIDPVCGKTLEDYQAHAVVDFKRVRFYLCCPLCQAAFEQTPERYARLAPRIQDLDWSIPPTKEQAGSLVYTVTVTRGTAA